MYRYMNINGEDIGAKKLVTKAPENVSLNKFIVQFFDFYLEDRMYSTVFVVERRNGRPVTRNSCTVIFGMNFLHTENL